MGASPAGGEGDVWVGGFIGVEVEEDMAATANGRRAREEESLENNRDERARAKGRTERG